ncbi:MAG TPA: xylulokinase, partial [Limnochordia bacterium]|nr:xylulokinase [Limnochordia bacterium]
MSVVLGIDIGTSATKTLAIDASGRVIARATREYPLLQPQPGWAEQDAEDWWRASRETIRAVMHSADLRGEDVAAIGLSGQMHGSVFLDASGEVVRPPLLWCDVRTSAECRLIEAAVGGREKLVELTGNPALEGFTAPKAVWLREHEPEHFGRVAKLCLPKDYVRFRLTGEIACEVSDAAGTLLFDVKRRAWSEPVLDALQIPRSWMPPVYESQEVCGRVTGRVAAETGLAAGTPVVGGGADNTCGALGAGIVAPGRVLASIGSSGVILTQADGFALDPKGRVHSFNHSVPATWYLMGVTLAAGLSLRWFRDQFGRIEQAAAELSGLDAYDLLGREAAGSASGARGLLFLPYLNGERTPHADANARGVLFGLSGAHTRGDVVRSILEGVTFSLRDSVEIFRELNQPAAQIRVIGGGAKSPLWRQIQADVFGAEVLTLAIDEGPAFGAALLAGVGAGWFAGAAEAAEALVKIGGGCAPD